MAFVSAPARPAALLTGLRRVLEHEVLRREVGRWVRRALRLGRRLLSLALGDLRAPRSGARAPARLHVEVPHQVLELVAGDRRAGLLRGDDAPPPRAPAPLH